MNPAQKRENRAAEYRRLAFAAGAQAQTCVLDHVREKHEQAAAQWTALALIDERPVRSPGNPAPQLVNEEEPAL